MVTRSRILKLVSSFRGWLQRWHTKLTCMVLLDVLEPSIPKRWRDGVRQEPGPGVANLLTKGVGRHRTRGARPGQFTAPGRERGNRPRRGPRFPPEILVPPSTPHASPGDPQPAALLLPTIAEAPRPRVGRGPRPPELPSPRLQLLPGPPPEDFRLGRK